MDEFLKKLSSSNGRHFWDGEHSEINSVGFDLSSTIDFRPPVEMQGSFDFVWSLERPLNDLGWKIRLDEMIRLLPAQGTLTFSYVQNEFISVPAVKSFLYRKYGVKSELIYEKISSPVIVNSYKIQRTRYQAPEKKWTFGMLTQGKKPKLVEDFCKSIREFGGPEHEIIICGPYSSSLDQYDVIYNSKVYSPLYADICKKKNDIVNMAKHENIMLLHDRYILNSDFFIGFDKYGYDFDFLTIRQYHASGKNYPAYCSIDDKGELIWGQISECTDYKKSWHSHYLNGGLLVGKTTLFKEIPFNDSIFHNQAEDVELTRVMLDAKIVPRFNMHSSAKTDVPDHLTNAFVVSNLSDLEKNVAGANSIWKILEVPPSDFASKILLKAIKILVKSYAVRNIGRVPWKEIFKKGIKKTNSFFKTQLKKKFFN